MTAHGIGVDIGTSAVRAAEVAVSGTVATLRAFGQVALPPGAVHDGTVLDEAAVAAALRRLWDECRFSRREVVLGVANQRLVVRQADLPAMAEADLRAAVRYEAADLIPLPLDEAQLDARILRPGDPAVPGQTMRVLLAAAQRSVVEGHLGAAAKAGLRPTAVDLTPLALLRSLGAGTGLHAVPQTPAELLARQAAEAVVCVGAELTELVVHEAGVPRLVRVLAIGGDDITTALAAATGTTSDEAEAAKRQAGSTAADADALLAAEVLPDLLTPLVEEIRGSLDYFQAQPDTGRLARVVLTGGSAALAGLADRLQRVVGCPVETVSPLARLKLGPTGLSDEALRRSHPHLAVPVGLALAGAGLAEAVPPLSLLPAEVAARRDRRRTTVRTGLALVGLTGCLTAASALRFSEQHRATADADAAAAQARVAQKKVDALGGANKADAAVVARRALATAALADDVAWRRVLEDLASATPDDVVLRSLAVQRTAGAKAGQPARITIQASGADQGAPARWLEAVGRLRSVSGAWVGSSSASGQPGGRVSFSATAVLTPAAASDRAAALPGAPTTTVKGGKR